MAASIATIIVANFCVVIIAAGAHSASPHLFTAIWPIMLTTTTAIVLVMSFLYAALNEILNLMEQREEAALSLGMYDPLTGLANRLLLQDNLTKSIERRKRGGERFAVLMLDLDHFKKVNDVLGHKAGDDLLVAVSSRLKELTREVDTVARLGGDEFVIVQTGAQCDDDSHQLCHRIVDRLSMPFKINDREVAIGVSIGAVLDQHVDGDASEYIRMADIALYRAKDNGRNGYQVFSSVMDAEVHRRAHIEESLRRSLPEGSGIEVHYQPQIDVYGQVKGFEALLRWQHPELGPIQPGEIVSIAEEVGLIDELGAHVFREACATAAQFPELSMAVNISALQFVKTNQLADQLKKIADEEGVPCEQIELEITEHLFLDKGMDCEPHIEALRALGFRIVLDDFGTGYSSLSYLRRFSVDKIKLDKSFADYSNLHNTVALIRAVVTLAHTLGLEVVVEGIETWEQEQVALEAGCDGFQGFRYGKAVSRDHLKSLPFATPEAA